jgi:mannose-6-phosphate isomerase
MDRIALLKNPVQEYAWGSKTAIQTLLGLPVPSEKPAAELWLGAHPKAPSEVFIDGEWQTLDKVIEPDPVSVLGKRVAERFSKKLPFLFKVLAADHPLSIQVHPNFEEAREGFERENRLGISLDASERNYKDANHKPEILCAITPFEGLKGFRTPEAIINLMDKVSISTLADELSRLRKEPDSSGLKRFFSTLVYLDQARRECVIDEAIRGSERCVNEDRSFYWMVELNREYPGDIGVLSPLIFNLIELEPGEAIYIPAGELHAYLKGVGMELMANSDNVLRGGLTPKHVDVPELLRIVNFSPKPVLKVTPRPGGLPGEKIYSTPAEEFQLSVISIANGDRFISERNRGVEIMICMEGKADFKDLRTGQVEAVGKGMSLIVPSAVPQYEISGGATLYKATVGRHLRLSGAYKNR